MVEEADKAERFWWRAGGAPVLPEPRPIFDDTDPTPRSAVTRQNPEPAPRRFDALELRIDPADTVTKYASADSARERPRWLAPAAAMLAVAIAAIVFARSAPDLADLPSNVEQAAAQVGLTIDQATVTGHYHVSDAAIFEALELHATRSILAYDLLGAKTRLEKMPWIAEARVTRSHPGGIAVEVIERQPAALWSTVVDGVPRQLFVDADGRTLGPLVPGLRSAAKLVRIVGEGADKAFPELYRFEALSGMFDAVARAERIGSRRWNLHFTSGLTVLLPSAGEDAVLRELRDILAAGIDRRIAEIDLRLAGRMTVRYAPGSPNLADAAKPAIATVADATTARPNLPAER
jgi:cell division protein FtsQ